MLRCVLYRRYESGCFMWRGGCISKGEYATPFYDYGQTERRASAKGRLLGVQFDALFTDDLYFEISRNALRTAKMLKKVFREKGYELYLESPTNQIFVVLENKKLKELEKEVKMSFWEKKDGCHTVVRFATSWATRMEDVYKLAVLL